MRALQGVYRCCTRRAAAFAVFGALGGFAGPGCAGGDGDFGSGPDFGSFGPATASSTTPTGGEQSTETGGSNTLPATDSLSDGTDAATTQADASTTGDTSGHSGEESESNSGGPCVLAAECDDTNPCTDDNCVNGTCDNAPRSCDDGLGCTQDACNPANGVCENIPDDTLCDDGNLCTGASTCDAVLDCIAGTPVDCQDADACTADTCTPATGLCSYDPIVACVSGDGCCPLGCSVADTDCVCTNLAPQASGASNGGGTNANGYGPAKWNDGVDEAGCGGSCTSCYGWVNNTSTPGGAFMEYTWPSTVVIGSMRADTTAPGGVCNSTGRYIPSGRVQWWNGGAWVDAGSWAGAAGDITMDFSPPISTTRLRLFDITAPAGGSNSLMFEWFIYTPLGCGP